MNLVALAAAAQLTAVSPRDLAHTAWRVDTYASRSLTRSSRGPSLAFESRERFRGQDGCNAFWGTYAVARGRLQVTVEGETTAACRDNPGRNAVRLGARFRQLLAHRPVIGRGDGGLVLRDSSGREARLVATKERREEIE